MTEEQNGRKREAEAEAAAKYPQGEPKSETTARTAAQREEQAQTAQGAGRRRKSGFGTAAAFWLLALYGLPGVGLIASALGGFLIAKNGAHRSLARACFVRGLIALIVAGACVGCYFVLRSRFALSNFLERILQDLLNFVRSNGDKL